MTNKQFWSLLGGEIVLAILVIVALVGGNNQSGTFGSGTRYPYGLSTDSTLPSAGEVRTTTLTVTGASTLTGTTTQAGFSYDGFIAYAGFTMATGTAKAVFTNTSGVNMMCGTGNLYFDGTTYAPAIVVGVGVSSSATGYSVSLLASTTIATTTDTFIMASSTAALGGSGGFRLATGSSIVGALSDADGAMSSSTNYSNWDVEMAFPCWLMGL